MTKHVTNAGVLVVHHGRDGGIVYPPVHSDDWKALRREPRDRLVLTLDTREDDALVVVPNRVVRHGDVAERTEEQ